MPNLQDILVNNVRVRFHGPLHENALSLGRGDTSATALSLT